MEGYIMNICLCFEPGEKNPCSVCRQLIKDEWIDQGLCPGCGDKEIHINCECVRPSIFEEN